MAPLVILIVTIIIISAVVGAIAQFLNKLNEMNAPPRRPGAARPEGGTVRQSDKDMDRFLAEIDRLRRRNQEGAAEQPAPAPAKPVAPPPAPRPTRQPERPRPRVVAELAEPPAPRRREQTDDRGFTTPHAAPPPPPSSPGDLPVATVVRPGSSTGAPATRVTTLPQRDRPTPKTDLARNLTGLLNSGQGVAMAVILQTVLGPPKSKQK